MYVTPLSNTEFMGRDFNACVLNLHGIFWNKTVTQITSVLSLSQDDNY